MEQIEPKIYHFETDHFALSAKGIHFLRSRFNYKTFAYSDIVEASFGKGKELKNWWLLTTIGTGLLVSCLFYLFYVWKMLLDPNVSRIYIEQIVAPIILVLSGGYFVYSGLKTAHVLKIKTANGKTDKVSFKELDKKAATPEALALLSNHLNHRLKINE